VEGLRLGDGRLGEELCAGVAAMIDTRTVSLEASISSIKAMIEAVGTGDLAGVQRLLNENPLLARTIMPDGLSAVLHAQYRQRRAIVDALLATGLHLFIHEAAALGEVERVRRILGYSKSYANGYARGGFTPLQLACYFGHPDVVRLLLDNGADLEAVARNDMRIRAIHAAVASRNAAIVGILIEAGADVNARQQDDYTPLMAAAQNKDEAIEQMLRAAGATE
jgi:hypothetical protein